jgi:hypothetical protein
VHLESEVEGETAMTRIAVGLTAVLMCLGFMNEASAVCRFTVTEGTIVEVVLSAEPTDADETTTEAEDEKAADEKAKNADGENDASDTPTADQDVNEVVVDIEKTEVQTDGADGKPTVKITGKVIFIGPDGQKKEIDLDSKEGQALTLKMYQGGGKPGVMMLRSTKGAAGVGPVLQLTHEGVAEEERFVIGVQCEEVSPLLQRHLKLESGGVVIVDVRDETPAAEAGMEKDDILTFIDDKPLKTRDELITMVTESEGRELSVTVIRDGETQVLKITPKKMKVPVIVAPAEAEIEEIRSLAGPGQSAVRLHRVHPGILLEGGIPSDHEALVKKLEALRRSAAAIRHEEDQHSEQPADIRDTVAELQAELKELREQITQLNKELDRKSENQKK